MLSPKDQDKAKMSALDTLTEHNSEVLSIAEKK